jgi:hypothetical protein
MEDGKIAFRHEASKKKPAPAAPAAPETGGGEVGGDAT